MHISAKNYKNFARFNLNLINSIRYTKTSFNVIIPNKIFLNLKHQLRMNTQNIHYSQDAKKFVRTGS